MKKQISNWEQLEAEAEHMSDKDLRNDWCHLRQREEELEYDLWYERQASAKRDKLLDVISVFIHRLDKRLDYDITELKPKCDTDITITEKDEVIYIGAQAVKLINDEIIKRFANTLDDDELEMIQNTIDVREGTDDIDVHVNGNNQLTTKKPKKRNGNTSSYNTFYIPREGESDDK